MRARDLGIVIGRGRPGPANAITDVAGVRVGHATIIRGDGPLVVGEGPVRTGVTMVVPHDGDIWTEPVYAGCHRLNGNGELTGLEWIREAGLLTGPIGITNTHSVGVVHDGIIRHAVRQLPFGTSFWALPVVGETWDGLLNDIDGFHVTIDHVDEAIGAASDGPVDEGNVGGGTGMVCHEFKGGIGTASRVVDEAAGGCTVGVLVQANYGRRELAARRRRAGRRGDPGDRGPQPVSARGRRRTADRRTPAGSGSIIVVDRDRRAAAAPPVRAARPAGRASGSPGWAAPAPTRAATCSCASRPATATLPQTSFRADPRLAVDVRAVNDFVDRRRCSTRRSRRPRRRSSTRSSPPRR